MSNPYHSKCLLNRILSKDELSIIAKDWIGSSKVKIIKFPMSNNEDARPNETNCEQPVLEYTDDIEDDGLIYIPRETGMFFLIHQLIHSQWIMWNFVCKAKLLPSKDKILS